MRKLTTLAVLLTLPLIACSANTTGTATAPTAGSTPPGKDSAAVGFIFVGPKDDFGYNQAAYQGSQEVAKAFPNLEVITAENVPEDDNAARVMNSMIAKGAKIIFATSYGHLDAALKVAAEHPDVAVVQQGNLITAAVPPNAGTFFGTVYEPVYLAGIAAGKATKTGKLGYVYAFPITQTIDNINAFELGAQSVNPDAQTFTVSTSSWCDPGKQAEAAANLLKQGVDVITQHQDCTATVIKATEAAGKFTVGYHADASAIAPKGWLTGSQWNWGPLYTDIVKTALGGTFTGSKYNDNFRVGYRTGENPFVQSPYGPLVDDATKAEIDKARELLKTSSPFAGPIKDQEGKVRIPEGTVPDYTTIEKIDYFVAGVVGSLPKS
ncbi:BMP family ABC transporter substrate-binding protein [Acrocarpospora macrocephala]|uniref:ABC transporter substrate-binding protein n=1 Tax=Acrocarpospora macrocephala TaxID=150177 RepID=A0A5M3WHJ6_9ACTN|nr:BMP family ABC transporter substrate-binding protein [Acrocarpospora macrocephala]GES07770.1 ABC transporter substrate-binding protein [Acrocarpospora macrocephala]